MTEAHSEDRLLGGRVTIRQPAAGYRTAIDPVLLAAAVAAKPGQRALELGCGVGAAALCLLARVPGLAVVGVERDAETAALAIDNGMRNGHDSAQFSVIRGDAATFRGADGEFHHVLMNPPYHPPISTASPDSKRSAATHGGEDLAFWAETAWRNLGRRGGVTLIWPTARLSEALAAINGRFGGARLLPLWPREGVPSKRILIRAVKDARSPEILLPGLVLHGEGSSYTEQARAILWEGSGLSWGKGS